MLREKMVQRTVPEMVRKETVKMIPRTGWMTGKMMVKISLQQESRLQSQKTLPGLPYWMA